jgi:DNA repair exonuclease SbcCD nuclease subunit
MTHSHSKGLFNADTHLQAFQYNNPAREEDYVRAFLDTLAKARNLKPRFVAFLGDLTNIRLENRATTKQIRKAFASLSNTGITIYTLRGNHDPEPIPFADILGLPHVKDAETAMLEDLQAGKPFTPYGNKGPKVCAAGYRGTTKLIEFLQSIRALETASGLPPSTELWLHAAITPAAPAIHCDLHAETLHSMGWHTVIAGDTHNSGLWQLPQGILVSPGSKEMTDINENPEKGEYLHAPKDDSKNPGAWEFLPYQGRPYRKWQSQGSFTNEELQFLCDWMKEAHAKTGLKPIVQIESSDLAGVQMLQPEIRNLALKITHKKPKKNPKDPQNHETGQTEALRKLPFEKCLLHIAASKKLRPRTLEILTEALTG